MTENPYSLEGKTILVTGASSGIGKASAIECSKMGATLIITGRDQERLNETLLQLRPSNHQAHIADLNDEESATELISYLPKLDGIVLCAGINQTLPISFLSRKKLDGIFNINFFSQVELLRIILKKKLLKENASVVALSSIGGNFTFSPGAAAYGASKAALLSWMRSCAKELAPKYRVNCICPGQINTPMNSQGNISEEQYNIYRESIPMKRFGEPEEVALAVVYLLSDATRWITGTTITIDGGTTL